MPATRNRETEPHRDGAVAPEAADAVKRAVALRYVGVGAALPDVPARDIYEDEIGAFDRKALLASGLYEK